MYFFLMPIFTIFWKWHHMQLFEISYNSNLKGAWGTHSWFFKILLGAPRFEDHRSRGWAPTSLEEDKGWEGEGREKVGSRSSCLTSSQGEPQIPKPQFFKSWALGPHPALGARQPPSPPPRCTDALMHRVLVGGAAVSPPPHSCLSSPIFPEQGTILLFSTERHPLPCRPRDGTALG